MARRSRRDDNRVERDINVVATPEFDRLLRPAIPNRPVSFSRPSDLRVVEDRRRFDPDERVGFARGVMGTPAKIVSGLPASQKKAVPGKTVRINAERFQFERPQEVMVCVRRKTRREVLFAHKKTGRGSKSPRLRNLLSEVSCGR